MEIRATPVTVIVAGVSALALIGVAFWMRSGGASILTVSKPVPIQVSNTSASELASDDDVDGLLNWQETLWGTSTTNADTDGDGVSDGAEVAAGTNPLREGSVPITEEQYAAPDSLRPTEALARELFATYIDGRQNKFSSIEQDRAIADIVAARTRELDTPTAITEADLTIDKTLSVAVYRGSLDTALRRATAVREYELNTFAKLFIAQGSQKESVAQLVSAATLYTSIAEELRTMPVPSTVATEHARLASAIETLGYTTARMSSWSADPLEALVLVNAFTEAEDTMNTALDRLYRAIRIRS